MSAHSSHIRVAVALPVYQTYTYAVPERLTHAAQIGKRVLVPFGRRRVTGYILGREPAPEQVSVKPIADVLDDQALFPAELVPFFEWVADYYIHPLGQVLQAALPGGINLKEQAVLALSPAGQQALEGAILSPAEQQLLSRLNQKPLQRRELSRQLKINGLDQMIAALKKQGLISVEYVLRGGRVRPKTERYAGLTNQPIPAGKLSRARLTILEALQSGAALPVRRLKALVPSAPTILRALEQAGHVRLFDKPVYRDPFGDPVSPDLPLSLNPDQQAAADQIVGALGKGYRSFLLAGVTGSGKTEVYMQAAASVIQNGATVLVLVPEIALISQMERRFRARFGEQVAVLHSGLSEGERFDQWLRIMRGQAPIAIGARSAIFAPFQRIGLLIVDEEHDTSYKQEGRLCYNARDLAVVRARLDDAVALLGSATPSVQSYYNALQGKFSQLYLPERVESRPMPEISVVDLRLARDKRGIRRLITPVLQQAITETLGRGEQVLLFLNRRGFANFPVCAACGESIRCNNCDITLTLHQSANAYRCHYCGFSRPSNSKCDHCGSERIKQLGFGTEKVADALQNLFPEARIGRMDRDTTTRKGAVVKILKDLRHKRIDLLIGTQMVAKGHDFPGITLVGIVCADLSLSFPDFRAGERTFQLLAQVSGRAGRGEQPGRVILQTYNPDHFSIHAARRQDFREFYKNDITYRKALNYPPFSRLVQFKISGADKQRTARQAGKLGELCRSLRGQPDFRTTIDVLGPIEAPLARIAGRHRWQILLKGAGAGPLHHFVNVLLNAHPAEFNARGIQVSVDVDPFFMM